MKVLVTGANSLLGDALVRMAPVGVKVEGTYHQANPDEAGPYYWMDLTDPSTIKYVMNTVKPDIVIHSAAEGNVDLAEKDYKRSYDVNCKGTVSLIKECIPYSSKFIFISTNAVFDGTKAPYKEYDPLNPINAYGKIKAEAERNVWYASSWFGLDTLIIRPIMLYGWEKVNHRKNWATMVIDKVMRTNQVDMVDDVFCQPTYVDDAAYAIWKLKDKSSDIFHLASQERLSFYEFALKVATVFGLDKNLIKPVSIESFKDLAPRPRDTTFDNSKICKDGCILSDSYEGLYEMKKKRFV